MSVRWILLIYILKIHLKTATTQRRDYYYDDVPQQYDDEDEPDNSDTSFMNYKQRRPGHRRSKLVEQEECYCTCEECFAGVAKPCCADFCKYCEPAPGVPQDPYGGFPPTGDQKVVFVPFPYPLIVPNDHTREETNKPPPLTVKTIFKTTDMVEVSTTTKTTTTPTVTIEIITEPTTPEPTESEPTEPEPTEPEPTEPEPTEAEPTIPEPTKPEPTKHVPIPPKPITPKPTTPKPTTRKQTTQKLVTRKVKKQKPSTPRTTRHTTKKRGFRTDLRANSLETDILTRHRQIMRLNPGVRPARPAWVPKYGIVPIPDHLAAKLMTQLTEVRALKARRM